NLSTNQPIVAQSISLATTASSNGNITIAGNLIVPGTIALTAGGAGAISDLGAFTLTGNTVTLASGTGDIGAPGAPILTAATNLSANSGGAASNVYVSNPGGVVLLAPSSATNLFAFTVGGNMSTSQPISAQS